MQVTELGLGASATDASVWKVAYGYGELDANGNVDQTKNTGNIAKQTISFNGLAQPFVQTFRYDSLYRITEAKEVNGTATTANWQQSWSYDRYGNRLAFAQNINGVTNNQTPTINTATNRFNTGQGFVYDKNGNITADVDLMEVRSFVFNGDNKQVEINKNGTLVGKYFYDGEGKRVKKVTNDETTIFVYSSGKLVAEYSTKLSQTPSTNFTTTDHLGSPRVITNELGQIKSRRDFMPFGEDLTPDTNNRTAALKYNTDEVRQKFTGYQKDTETGLDFAEARMYNNTHGRFTAVDPLMASGKSANPQTFNRYIYVGNNPIGRIDPHGTDWYFLNGEYRWSSDNINFDRTLSHPLNPGAVDGWTRVLLDDKGEYRYFTDGKIPGTSREVLLTDKEIDIFGNHWDYTGKEIITDQAAVDAFFKEQQQIIDGFAQLNLDREMNDALRPLTDTKTGSNPTSPRLGLVFDNMVPATDGLPSTANPGGRYLSARQKDFDSATGLSAASSPNQVAPHKLGKDQLFCFICKDSGANIVMDPNKSTHLLIQPKKSIEDMSFEEYQNFVKSTRPFWRAVNNQ